MAILEAIALALLFVFLAMAFATICVLTGHRLIRSHVSSSHNVVMTALFGSASVVYAVLLGFLVVVVWESYDSAHQNVAQEAATLVPLYRLTYGMTLQSGKPLRGMIRNYTEALISDEWPMLGTTRTGSRNARRLIGDMDRHFALLDSTSKAADAQVNTEFLRTKSSIVAARNQRLLEASDSIPWVMWLGAIGGGVLTTFMSALLYMTRLWPQLLMSLLIAALTGLLLFIMAVLSRPFSGPLAIGPEYFTEALQVMDDVDRGY